MSINEPASDSRSPKDFVVILIAVWFFVSPWVLHFAEVSTPENLQGQPNLPAATWNCWIVGVVSFVVAVTSLRSMRAPQEWLNVVLGLWLLAAPWVIGIADLPMPAWDCWSVGAALFGVSLWRVSIRGRNVVPGLDLVGTEDDRAG